MKYGLAGLNKTQNCTVFNHLLPIDSLISKLAIGSPEIL